MNYFKMAGNGREYAFLYFLLYLISGSIAEHVPAAIWIKNSSKQSSSYNHQFKQIRSKMFKQMMAPMQQGRSNFVVVAEPVMNENDLFNEDNTYFKNLRNVNYPMYRLNIKKKVTTYLFSATSVRWRYLTLTPGTHRFKLPALDNASLFLTLDSDLGINKNTLFHRHDKLLAELLNLLNERLDEFLFMFTSFSTDWNVDYIDDHLLIGPQIFSKPVLFKNKEILMFSKTSPVITIIGSSYLETLWLTNFTSLEGAKNKLVVQAPQNSINIGSIRFQYTEVEGYSWSLEKIIISPKHDKESNDSLWLQKEVTLKIIDGIPHVGSFSEMSYHCHRSIVFTDQEGKMECMFSSLQLWTTQLNSDDYLQTQPGLTKMAFGESQQCLDLFSPMYIVYIFIAFLYLFIIFLMLKLLNDIQIHTEFEDPNKPHLIVTTAPM